jgi:large subunit ribosomal protein L13
MEEVCVSLDKNGQRQQISQTENSQQRHRNEILVDATGCIAGRMCSHVSKLLLKGNRVTIVNSEKAMLSGNRYKTIDLYKEFLEINSVTNPIHGPFHPRRPDTMLTKMVRGMVPKTKTSGIEAFKRLRVYIGIPDQFMNKKAESFEDSKITRPPAKYISMGEVAKQIGWKGVLQKEVRQQPQIQKAETKTKGGQKGQKSIVPPQEVNKDKEKKRENNE